MFNIGTVCSMNQPDSTTDAERQAVAKKLRAKNRTYAEMGLKLRWIKKDSRGGGPKHFVLCET